MKLFTLAISMLLITTANFAQTTICPDYFRRNNGNGTCGGGQLKLYYTTCPSTPGIIDSVYANGVKANVTFDLPNASKCSSQGFVSYCISGNMPPTSIWTIYFHNTEVTTITGCVVAELASGPLPISIASFSAKRNGGKVSLSWQTSFELNAIGFEIQKKSGNSFITVGTVSATNKETGSSYSFTDINNSSEVSEYRLKLNSEDAAAKYSEIKSVKGSGSAFDFTVYPNPAVRNARVVIADISQPTNAQVIDNAGRVIKIYSLKNTNTIELNNLQTGIYRIRLVNVVSGEAITKTLTVVR